MYHCHRVACITSDLNARRLLTRVIHYLKEGQGKRRGHLLLEFFKRAFISENLQGRTYTAYLVYSVLQLKLEQMGVQIKGKVCTNTVTDFRDTQA